MDAEHLFKPHDLLWAVDASSFTSEEALPAWSSSEWLRYAPAVIRRERVADPDCLPVGLRGVTRDQRHKAYLRRDCVARWVSPEMLSQAVALDHTRSLARFAAIDTLIDIAPMLDALPLAWGPTGSVGFTLASGIVVLGPDSDLDLLVRAPRALDAGTINVLCAMETHASCRLDIQIDTGHGAFSFAEWVQGRRSVLLKTDAGPLLTHAPWSVGAGAIGRPK